MVELGDKVKDTVSGFEGIAIARTEWLHGCTRVTVQPDKVDKDGKVRETHTFDEPQLVVLKPKKIATGRRDTGGPMPTPQQKPEPVR